MEHKQIWTEEIKANDSLLSVNLREVWHYRDLLLMLLKRDFITFYKQTILGPIWFFIQPIMTMIIYVILFGQVAKLGTDGVPQVAFYFAGIVIWNYFSEVLMKTATVFKDNANVFGKVYFPRLIMPLSVVCSGLLKFAIQFSLFVIIVVYYSVSGEIQPNIWILATPFLILLMATFALGLGMILSALTTKYKDLILLMTFGVQLFMYATPVFYSINVINEKSSNLRPFVEMNPLTGIFECFRYGYLGSGSFTPTQLIYSSGVAVVLLIFGVLIFNKVQRSFMDTV